MSFAKWLIGNAIGSALVIGFLYLFGCLAEWVTAFFLPQGFATALKYAIVVFSVLGLPAQWRASWHKFKIAKATEEYWENDMVEAE